MPGTSLPAITLPLVAGGELSPGSRTGGWELFIVYRGRHCPRCKTYLSKLESLAAAFADIGVSVAIASADSLEDARADVTEFGWTVPVGHGLTTAQMQALGLYISQMPDSGRRFSEPGLFVTNPDGVIQVLGISNAASCRPDLDVILDGIKGIQTRGLPIFGTVMET